MTHVQQISERRYDLDWLRVLTILSVFFYHIGMFFNTSGWHVKNNETSEFLRTIMSSLHTWRLPLLLFISGAGTILASSKRTTFEFVKERHRRLLLPVIFGMLVVVPPQVYVERFDQYASYWDFYKTIFEFVAYPKGSLTWHHLWFVVYLFFFSMLALPFMNFLKSDKSDRFLGRIERFFSMKWSFQTIALIILLCHILLHPYYPQEKHNLTSDWNYFTKLLIFFLAGMLTCSSDKLWKSLVIHRRFNLKMTLFFHFIFYFLYFLPFKTYQQFVPFSLNDAYDYNEIFMAWSTIISIIGYGRVYLSKNHQWLKPMNEAIYPFYILHQTVILVFGFIVADWQINLWLKLILLTVSSFVTILGIYHYLVRPFNLTRVCFGMHPRRPVKQIKQEEKVA
ncbi:MAG: acyltransferase [Calditrichaeota bacterium]|nr:acyltransferase [Calditrichota bacterium]